MTCQKSKLPSWKSKHSLVFKAESGVDFCEISNNEKCYNELGVMTPRMYATNDATCPIKSLRKYLTKLHPSCEFLFAAKTTLGSSRLDTAKQKWYMRQRIGENSFGVMMKSIAKRLSLSHDYTNHSIKTTAANLLLKKVSGTRYVFKLKSHFPPPPPPSSLISLLPTQNSSEFTISYPAQAEQSYDDCKSHDDCDCETFVKCEIVPDSTSEDQLKLERAEIETS